MNRSSWLAFLFLLSVFPLVPGKAQVATGTINVSVADATGAMVPGASIKVTNNGTGLLRAGVANERGELSIPYLPVGQYSIVVEIAGFKRTSIEQVVLQVDQTASVHVTLQPGEVITRPLAWDLALPGPQGRKPLPPGRYGLEGFLSGSRDIRRGVGRLGVWPGVYPLPLRTPRLFITVR